MFNCYFGLTKYHIYEESTYPIINKKNNNKKQRKKEKFPNGLFHQTEGSDARSPERSSVAGHVCSIMSTRTAMGSPLRSACDTGSVPQTSPWRPHLSDTEERTGMGAGPGYML